MTTEIISKLAGAVRAENWEAVVCLSPENIAYGAGFVVPSQTLMRWRHAALVITADGGVLMVCVDMEEATVRAARPDWEVRTWAEFTENAMIVLGKALADLGLDRSRIGVELDYLPAASFAELRAACPGADFVSADHALTRSRRIKTADEIVRLATLSRISDRAIKDAFASVSAGDTEMDLAATLTRRVYEQGAQSFKLMIVATGERSQLPNVGPTTRALQPGDVCRVEIFSVMDGYQAGVCRTAVVGEPSVEARQVYRNLSECKRIVLDAMTAGARACDVYTAYRRHFDSLGMPAIGFVGHGIGVNLHEAPYLSAQTTDELEPNMVFGVEPLVYRSGHGFGMQIKDMVQIHADGAVLLSDVTDTTDLIRIEA